MNPKSGWAEIGLVLAAFLVGLCQACLGQAGDVILEAPGSEPLPTPVPSCGAAMLFQNVRIFNGKSTAPSAPSDVLVRGNTIERISASPITVNPNANVHEARIHGHAHQISRCIPIVEEAPLLQKAPLIGAALTGCQHAATATCKSATARPCVGS